MPILAVCCKSRYQDISDISLFL